MLNQLLENPEPISLDIRINVELEKRKIRQIWEKLPWYREHGYNPRFPKGTNLDRDTIEAILDMVDQEFDPFPYQDFTTKLQGGFDSVKESFLSSMYEVFQHNLPKILKITLTQYGTGGSYGFPDMITMNILTKSPVNILLHEIVHLFLEPYIGEYKLEQNEKERLVDLIMASGWFDLSGEYLMQERGLKHAKTIDPLFDLYFNKSPRQFFIEYCKVRNGDENGGLSWD